MKVNVRIACIQALFRSAQSKTSLNVLLACLLPKISPLKLAAVTASKLLSSASYSRNDRSYNEIERFDKSGGSTNSIVAVDGGMGEEESGGLQFPPTIFSVFNNQIS